jgi:hypothetical protein
MIAHLLFITTSNSRLSISIALCYAFAIASTFVDCCISTSTMLSSLASVFVIYASTKCYSTTSSSSNSSMNIRSTNVIPSHVYSLARQPLLLLRKNSNYKCSSCIYVLNYCWHKLYLFIICLPFCTIQR